MNWIEKKFEDEQCNKSGVTVKLSLPTAAPEKNCAFCNIVFIYHGRNKIENESVPGIDEFQALELSFKFIRQTLLAYPGRLMFNNMCVEEVFPYSIDPFLGRFSRTMEKFVEDRTDNFHMRRGKRLEARQKRKRR